MDYFASIPTANLKADSSNTLREVANALRNRFPKTSGIRVDSPAVVVPFGTDASEAYEVIPADLVRNTSGKPRVYEIADSGGGWMRSSPDAHNAYVRSVDKELDGRVKPLIRFLKAWKYYKSVPISSFYLELVVAEYAAGEGHIIYSYDVRDVFTKMSSSRLAAIDDPAGESGRVSPCKTSLQKADALKKVETALGRARKAREREGEDDVSGAFYWWDLLFDNEFPAYYYSG